MKNFKLTESIRKTISIFTFCYLIVVPLLSKGQGTFEDYQRAEKFLHFNADKLVRNLNVRPYWIDETSDFWYRTEPDSGKEQFLIWNAEKNTVFPAFDHKKLALSIAGQTETKVKPDSLPFNWFEFKNKREKICFWIDTIRYSCDLKTYKIEKEEKGKNQKNVSVSPDKKWKVFVHNYNLYLTPAEGGDTVKLTTEGVKKHEFATPLSWYAIVDESVGEKYDPEIDITWSPDSKRFVTYQYDRRKVEKLYLLQSLPKEGMRAKIWSYERPLPGEPAHTKAYYIFDVEKQDKVKADLAPQAGICEQWSPTWLNDGKELYFVHIKRGYRQIDLFKADPATGKVKNIISEKAKTMIEYQMAFHEMVNKGEQIIWASERDGWNHLYLYNGQTGEMINQITNGEYVVREIKHVDEKGKQIWFIAGGKEQGRDPYYQHLYKINVDGSGLTLLTPENADHHISVSPDGKYFTDTYSRADLKPVSVIRRMKDGKQVREIQQADISKLLAEGWKYPEPFRVKARDGKTDIYGLIFYPSNFDAFKKYPVIDATYTGPHAVRTPKSFARCYRNADQPLAELGFIVITIDGMGTAMRSKAFHDVSYRNLGDIGAPDHIAGIKQLAEKYPFMDTTRVGIYGHSAGGYDAAHALLTHGDFYKVAVSSAGNHDHGMAKAWWPEQYMGLPGEHYNAQSNLTLAKNMEGKLLLVTGDMDNNVNPASTYRFAAELVQHNKDVDLVIIPNHDHGLYDNKYFIRKRWDYFVEYLMGVKPPKSYKIN